MIECNRNYSNVKQSKLIYKRKKSNQNVCYSQMNNRPVEYLMNYDVLVDNTSFYIFESICNGIENSISNKNEEWRMKENGEMNNKNYSITITHTHIQSIVDIIGLCTT